MLADNIDTTNAKVGLQAKVGAQLAYKLPYWQSLPCKGVVCAAGASVIRSPTKYAIFQPSMH